MGANGSLGIVNLRDHSFQNIKERILSSISTAYDSSYDDSWENLFFKVCESETIDELSFPFLSKVVDFVAPQSGIQIEGQIVNNWAGASVPCIVGDYLVLYETTNQMPEQNILFWALGDFMCNSAEIWT